MEEYLGKFVDEVKLLEINGLSYDNCVYNIRINSFVCDAPARAFIKNIKGHSGYYGCEKCIQEGEYHGKITFPELNSVLRSDESFHTMKQEEHHKGPSPLTALSLGMVSQFPLDYMHLVCLGVMKRFLHVWLRGSLKFRLSGFQTLTISDKLVSLLPYIPHEFSRKPRALSEVDRWKATELRLFLLYTGPVVLKE